MSDIVIYQADNGETNLDVHLEQESVWLNLNQMTDLFGRDKSVLSRHLNNVFRENELDRQSVVAKFATTDSDGKTYQVDHYDLDVIISVGYRVNLSRAQDFVSGQHGSKRLADNALVALTLLIAESQPEEKDTIVKVIVNLINRSND